MKLASKMFALTALSVACSAASAQQTAPLTVTGNITPPACTASMSNDGAFKYSDIDAVSLSDANTGTVLPASPAATFNISCLGASQVAWAIVDNRSDSPYFTSDTGMFGLGKDKDGNKIGSYLVRMNQPTLDGANAYAMRSSDGGKTWAYLERNGYVMRPGTNLYTYSKTGNWNSLDKGSVFSASMLVYPTIAPKGTLNTSDEIDLDGSTTINLSYL